MCDRKETEFESRLIWNDDRTQCFMPEEFSNAKVWDIPGCVIEAWMKNGRGVSISRLSDKEKAKARLQELMEEIGEKLKIADKHKTLVARYRDGESIENIQNNNFADFLDTADREQLRKWAIMLAPFLFDICADNKATNP